MTMVVMVGERGARTPHGTSLQGKDRAVRWRRSAGLCSHLLIGGQLEGSQKTYDKRNISSDVASSLLLREINLARFLIVIIVSKYKSKQ